MSIHVSTGFQIPTNVVEVGNEITAQQLAAITNASFPDGSNVFVTGNVLTNAGYISGDAPSDSTPYSRQNGAWVSSTTGISDAPSDGSTYGRKNGTWESITSGISDAPADGQEYVRKNNNWVVSSSGGSGSVDFVAVAGAGLCAAFWKDYNGQEYMNPHHFMLTSAYSNPTLTDGNTLAVTQDGTTFYPIDSVVGTAPYTVSATTFAGSYDPYQYVWMAYKNNTGSWVMLPVFPLHVP